MTSVLIRKGKRHREGAHQVTMEAEMKTHPASQVTLEWQDAARSKEGSSPRGSEESMALPTLSFGTCSLHNWERINFCCWKPPVCGSWLQEPYKINTADVKGNETEISGEYLTCKT